MGKGPPPFPEAAGAVRTPPFQCFRFIVSFFEAGRVSACRGYELALEKKSRLYQKWTAAQSQSERWRVQRAPRRAKGKNVKPHEGRMRRQVGKREQADVSNMPPVNSPICPARIAQADAGAGHGTPIPQSWPRMPDATMGAGRPKNSSPMPRAGSQPDPPIPERADKTADVQRLPYLPPYFLHSDPHPLKGPCGHLC